MAQLHFPSWLPLEDIRRIVKVLGNARIVGGCVRDILLKRKFTDCDLATPLLPEEVLQRLQKNKIKCIPTGLKHGTVTAVLNGHHYEITTLRKDVTTFGRHAEVEYVDSWEEDSARRDFTINAMYLDLDGKLFDFHNGREDLKTKLIKFVGNPEQRVTEDYLRILRYFRFISYFGDKHIDIPSYKACTKLVNGLHSISAERVWMEMHKILQSTYINSALKLMHKAKVLKTIGFERFSTKALGLKYSDNPLVNLAVLIKLSRINPDVIIKCWKLSNKDAALIRLSQNPPNSVSKWIDHEKNIYLHGIENYIFFLKFDAVMKQKSVSKPLLTRVSSSKTKVLPIKGETFLKLGYHGKVVGVHLKKAEKLWLTSNFKLNKDDLIKKVIYDKPIKLK